MSKTSTHNKTYLSLLENSLHELFSPRSKKALLDYDQLKLIDPKQLNVIDWEQLKLIDSKELALLDVAVLSIFFQYIGAFFLTLSLGFMVSFGVFTLHNSINSVVLAEGNPSNANVYAQAPVSHSKRVELASAVVEVDYVSRSSFAVLDEKPVVEAEVEKSVLGASTNEEPVVLVAPNSCSFRVVEGKKIVRISSGSQYAPSKVFKLCVDSAEKSSAYSWSLDSKTTDNNSDCVTSYEIANIANIDASVLDETGNTIASCDLSLVKSAIMAAN